VPASALANVQRGDPVVAGLTIGER
jgi:hypothetical protein